VRSTQSWRGVCADYPITFFTTDGDILAGEAWSAQTRANRLQPQLRLDNRVN
jgi:hypothetical protein